LKRRLIYAIVLLAIITSLGTVGFLLVEPTTKDPFEAFYFTVVTMFTVGYGDFVPTTTISRLLAMIVVVGGVTAAVAALQSIFDLVVTKDIRRELGLPERRTKMKDHIIICGYGNVGQRIVEQLKGKSETFLFIESDPQKIADLVDKHIPVIQGDAGDKDVLTRANVKEAKTMILTLRDSSNIIVAIMAKMLNPNIFIVSEVEDMRNLTVLKKAGADEVVHCHEMGARTMVSKARKIVIDTVCGAEVDPRRAPFSTDFKGAKYYFDSQECMDAFAKNPDRFMEMQRVVEATCSVR
jgi:voltage-gated potassium channel